VSPFYVGTMNFLYVMASFIGTVIGSVVVLSILNSMTMTILERSREIGTFRSIGFTRTQMLGLFVREGVLLTGVGVLLGGVLAYTTAGLVNMANIRFSPPGVPGTMQLLLTPNLTLGAVLAAAMLALAILATVTATWARVQLGVATLNTSLAA
jgi:putative ABC transport system permease protein